MPRSSGPDEAADVGHRDGVDAGEGLVQQQILRIGGEAARDLDPPALAARERQRRRAAQMRRSRIPPAAPRASRGACRGRLGDLEDGQDVVLDVRPRKIETSCGR
jgi:hypothetical protein